MINLVNCVQIKALGKVKKKKVSDLVNTGTIVERMWVTGVIHKTCDITGGV